MSHLDNSDNSDNSGNVAVFPATFPYTTVNPTGANTAGAAHAIGTDFLNKIILEIKEMQLKKSQKKSQAPICLFITGTDTEVGKTYMSVKLLNLLKQDGFKTIGLKPIASGCIKNQKTGALENDDALKLQAAATIKLPYSEVNPFAFELPIAPHIAAATQKNITLSAEALAKSTQAILEKYCPNPIHSTTQNPSQTPLTTPDIILIEGAGGFELPLNSSKNNIETLGDYAALLNEYLVKRFGPASALKTIVVVGMKLGCLNHALLTFNAIKQKSLKILGFIPNSPPHFSSEGPMPFLAENIESLKQFFN